MSAETQLWRPFPPRQITGEPLKFYGYVGRTRYERHCCERKHRSHAAAEQCASRVAKKLNR